MRRAPSLRIAGEVLLVPGALIIDLIAWGSETQLRWGGDLPVWLIPALSAVVYSTLWLRWRKPVAVYALLWVFGLTALATPGYEPFVGLLIALHAVARTATRRTAATALLGCAVPFSINAYNAAAASADAGGTFAGSAAFWAAISITVWGLGRLAYAAERRAEEHRRAEAVQAVREERLRVARDLHDVVSHSVNAMLLQAAGARRQHPGAAPGLLGALEAIENTGVGAMTELHEMLGLLREASASTTHPAGEVTATRAVTDSTDNTGQTTSQTGTPGAGRTGGPSTGQTGGLPGLGRIDELVTVAEHAGLGVTLVTRGHPRPLNPAVDVTAYRLIQEGLTNAMKYAGSGARVTITLAWGNNDLEIDVRDQRPPEHPDGTRGAPGAGLGLQGLTERVHTVGGQLRTNDLGDGFDLIARLPAPKLVGAPETPATHAVVAPTPTSSGAGPLSGPLAQ